MHVFDDDAAVDDDAVGSPVAFKVLRVIIL
jgi:hypothetical protein